MVSVVRTFRSRINYWVHDRDYSQRSVVIAVTKTCSPLSYFFFISFHVIKTVYNLNKKIYHYPGPPWIFMCKINYFDTPFWSVAEAGKGGGGMLTGTLPDSINACLC